MADSQKTTPIKREFHPTEQFGLAGLQTFDDPEFIDDNALASCLNVTIDGPQIAPRQGTNLLYAKPVGETGSPEQLFKFVDGEGNQWLLAKYTQNWYLLDSSTGLWLKVGSQDPSDPLYIGYIWIADYYSNDIFAGGIGSNLAFFAPSTYSVPDNDSASILMWPTGLTHVSADASIGDTEIAVDDASLLSITQGQQSLVSVGGQLILATPQTSVNAYGVLQQGSDLITGLVDATIFEPGAQVQGIGIVNGTTVISVVDANTLQISFPATITTTTTFSATGDITNGSPTVANLMDSVTLDVTLSAGSNIITGVGASVSLLTVGMAVVGPNIATDTVLTDVNVSSEFVRMSTSAEFSAMGNTTTFYNIPSIGMVVSGGGIPGGTTITALAGSAPSYTGFTMSNNATTTATASPLTLSGNIATLLTFTENDILQVPALTAPITAGTAISPIIQPAPIPYQGNALLVWQAQLVIATSSGLVAVSTAGNPLSFSGITSGVSIAKGGRIEDLKEFGQFFLAGSEDAMQVGQALVNSEISAVGTFFTSYLAGQGMGPVSGAGNLSYNNEYYYPSATNGIIALTPSFTGTSSSAGLQVLTDKIHNLFKMFTFLRAAAYDRKIWWRVSVAATPEHPIQYYYLIYDLIRNGFTLIQHPSVDLTVYVEQLCLFGTDGNIYQAEYDSYEDYIGGETVGYLAEAYSKRWDYSAPELPKSAQFVMVQGRLLTGKPLNIDVLYNEGGALGKTTYQIVGNVANPYFTLPDWGAMGSDPLSTQVLSGGRSSVGYFRVYLELNQSFNAHTFQLRFWSDEPGSYWSVATVAPEVEVMNVPSDNVISPN